MPICRRTGSHSDVNPAHEFSGFRFLLLHELLDILFAVTAFRTRAGRFRDRITAGEKLGDLSGASAMVAASVDAG